MTRIRRIKKNLELRLQKIKIDQKSKNELVNEISFLEYRVKLISLLMNITPALKKRDVVIMLINQDPILVERTEEVFKHDMKDYEEMKRICI